MAFVQGAHNSAAASATTLTATFGAGVTSGNAVWGIIAWNSGTGSASVTVGGVSATVLDTVHDVNNAASACSFIIGNISGAPTSVVATFSPTEAFRTLVAVEESGCLAASNPTDKHTGQLQAAPGTGANVINSGNVTTVVASDIIVGAYCDSQGSTVGTAGTSPLAFTLRTTDAVAGEPCATEDGVILVTPGTAASTFGQTNADSSLSFVIAIQPASGAAAVTIGWSRSSDPERPRTPSYAADVKQAFLSTFVTAKTPTSWVKFARDDPERLPALKRPPDEPFPFFQRSLIPVPARWLPTSGSIDRERLPPIQRTDWAVPFFNPAAAFTPISGISWYDFGTDDVKPAPLNHQRDETKWFFRPSQIPVPTTWLPQPRAEEARPVAVRQAPDEGIDIFFRSPASFLAIWLPTTGEEDRAPSIKCPPDDRQPFVSTFLTAKTPTTWIKYARDDPERLPALKQPDERAAWAPRSFAPPVGISGIAWYVLQEGKRPPPPPEPYVIQTLPPFIEPPLQPFLAQSNADDFNPLKAFTFEEQSRGLTLRPTAASVGISGIAWWQSIEVHIAPPPPQLDYRSSYAPNAPTASVGISGMAWFRSAEQIIRPPSIDQNWSPSWVPFVTSSGFHVAWAVPSNYITGGVAT